MANLHYTKDVMASRKNNECPEALKKLISDVNLLPSEDAIPDFQYIRSASGDNMNEVMEALIEWLNKQSSELQKYLRPDSDYLEPRRFVELVLWRDKLKAIASASTHAWEGIQSSEALPYRTLHDFVKSDISRNIRIAQLESEGEMERIRSIQKSNVEEARSQLVKHPSGWWSEMKRPSTRPEKQLSLRDYILSSDFGNLPGRVFIDEDGFFRVNKDRVAEALEGAEVIRLRLCAKCDRIFWAKWINARYCSPEHANAHRAYLSRNLSPKQKEERRIKQKSYRNHKMKFGEQRKERTNGSL